MPAHVNKRVPSSCEPCRQRKIRCHGTRVPCDTCVRRGRATACQYQRDSVPAADGPAQSNDNEALLKRIAHIEDLLQKQNEINSAWGTPSPQAHLSTRNMLVSPASSLPEPHAAEHTTIPDWALTQSSSGHVRLISQAAELESSGSSLLDDLRQPSSMTHTNFPFFADVAASRQQLLDLLPPASHCDRLKEVYLQVFSPLFHILHEPSFEQAYAQFRREPARVSLSFLGLLFVVFGIAVMALADDDPLLDDLGHESSARAKIKATGSKYQSAAMKSLAADGFMWQHNLDTVKTLVLMIYSLSHTKGPTWPLLGATLNIAVAIGCHIDPSRLRNVHMIEAEERRRCWAALMMLYTIQNTCLGNIAPITITASVKLPADLEDDELDSPNTLESRPDRVPSKMAYILHKFALYNLASRICQLPKPGPDLQYTRVASLDRELEDEEASQAQKLGHLRNLPTYHQAHSHILSIYTNHLFIVLHRSCINPAAAVLEAERLRSIRRCVRSATQVLVSHNALCTQAIFKPYLWYAQSLGAFHALLAATTLLAVANDASMGAETAPSSIQPLLVSCLQTFRELCHRSEICLSGRQFLERVLAVSSSTPSQHYGVEPLSGSHGQRCSPRDGELLEPSYSAVNVPSQAAVEGQGSHTSFSNLSGHDDVAYGGGFTGVNGWNANLDLLNFVSNSPHEHWLSPTAFGWDQWFLNEAFIAPHRVGFS